MAEQKDKPGAAPPDDQQQAGSGATTGATPDPAPPAPAKEPAKEPKAKTSGSSESPAARGRAGEYVVIADQLPLKEGTGKDAAFTTHPRGSTVKLTAAQAAALSSGTRPVVVAASEVKDGDVAGAGLRALRRAAQERAEQRKRR